MTTMNDRIFERTTTVKGRRYRVTYRQVGDAEPYVCKIEVKTTASWYGWRGTWYSHTGSHDFATGRAAEVIAQVEHERQEEEA